jgi:type IX secretion system PorP/SprF family membrane protein
MRPGRFYIFKVAIVLGILLPATAMFSQDIHFTQFTNCVQQYNPALTGLYDQNYKIGLIHKQQWASIGSGYTTSGVDAQFRLPSLYNDNSAGFGLLVLQDKAGIAQMKTFSAKGTFAYHLAASAKDLLSAGLQVGYDQRSLNLDGLAWDSQYNGINYDPTMDDRERFLTTSKGALDLSLGLNWRHKGAKKKFMLGYAMHHTGQQVSMIARGDDKLKVRQTWHASTSKRYEFFDLKYDFLVQREAGAMEIIIGGTFDYRIGNDSRYTNIRTSSAARAGLFYRVGDAIHPFIGFEYKRMAVINLGYDIRLAKMDVKNGCCNKAAWWSGDIGDIFRLYRRKTDEGAALILSSFHCQ